MSAKLLAGPLDEICKLRWATVNEIQDVYTLHSTQGSLEIHFLPSLTMNKFSRRPGNLYFRN